MTFEEAMALVRQFVTIGGLAKGGGGGGAGSADDPYGFDEGGDDGRSAPTVRRDAQGRAYEWDGRDWVRAPQWDDPPGGGGGSAGSSVPYDTVEYGGNLYRFNRSTGDLELVGESAGGGDPWQDPMFQYQVQQDALARLDRREMQEREDARWRAQTAIEAALMQYNAGISAAQLKAQLSMQAQQLEQQARVAQQSGREGTANVIMQYAQMLRDAEQNPFRLGEYLVNLQRMEDQGGETPLSQLIGEGMRIEPQLPDPFKDPRWEQLLDAMYQYGLAPPPEFEVPDFEIPQLDIEALLQKYLGGEQQPGGFEAEKAILEAYASNPALAQQYFSASEKARQDLANAGQPAPRNELAEFLKQVQGYTPEEQQAIRDIAAGKTQPSQPKAPAPAPSPTPTRSPTGQTVINPLEGAKLKKFRKGGSMVAHGPMGLFDLMTGEMRALMGEAGDPELLEVTPMTGEPDDDDVLEMALGGSVAVMPRDPRTALMQKGFPQIQRPADLRTRTSQPPIVPGARPAGPAPPQGPGGSTPDIVGQDPDPGELAGADVMSGGVPRGLQALPSIDVRNTTATASTVDPTNLTEQQAAAIAAGRALQKLSFVPRDAVNTLLAGGILRPGQTAGWFEKLGPILRKTILSATQMGGIPLEDWEFERAKYETPGTRLAVVR